MGESSNHLESLSQKAFRCSAATEGVVARGGIQGLQWRVSLLGAGPHCRKREAAKKYIGWRWGTMGTGGLTINKTNSGKGIKFLNFWQ